MAEVGSAFVTVIPSAKGFGKSLDGQVGGDLDSSGKRAGTRFGTGLKVGALAAVGAAGLAAGFLKGAVSAASDLAESQSKVGVVFGKSAGQIMSASKTSASAMGLSKQAYLDATGTFGNLLVSLDLGPKKAANMSQQMVKLAGDLASFNNVSPEEALDAIKSGLTGETEPLKRFGVNMNDATLKAQAMKMGLISSTKEALTPQNKALAAQALIMKQTKTAQGDFARTSGGLANQQRILAANFANTKATIGKVFLPIVTKLVVFMNNLGPVFAKVGTAIGPAAASVKAFFASFGGAGGGGALTSLVTTFKSVGTSIATNFLPVLKTLATTFVTQILPVIQRFGAYVVTNLLPIFRQVGTIIATQVVPIIAMFAQFIYGRLLPAVVRIATQIGGSLKPVFDQLVATFRGSVLPAVQQLLAKFREWWPTISKVIMFVVKVTGTLLRLAAAILGRVLPPLIRFAGFMIKAVVAAVIAVITIVAKIISTFIKFGGAVITAANKVGQFATTVKQKIGQALGFIKDIPGKAKSALGNLSGTLIHAGEQLISGLITGIGHKMEQAVQKVRDGLNKIKGLLPGSPIKWGPLKSWNNTGPKGPGGRLVGLLADGVSGSTALDSAMNRVTSRVAVRPPQMSLGVAGGGAVAGRSGALVHIDTMVTHNPAEAAYQLRVEQAKALTLAALP